MTKPLIYTVGHSNHPIDYFLELLHHYQVNFVVDVRSMPSSRFNPQFNKNSLATSLTRRGIQYLHFGESFGARQTDPAVLDMEGRVDFEKIRRTERFQTGVTRLWKGAQQGFLIALMCSEAEPLQCHRFIMISPALKGFDVRHILKDKSSTGQDDLERQLIKRFAKALSQTTAFDTVPDPPQALAAAYRMMNREIGFVPGATKKGARD